MSGSSNKQDGSRSQQAIVRLRGAREAAPAALLEMAEGVRRALLLVGVTDVRIELEAEDEGAV